MKRDSLHAGLMLSTMLILMTVSLPARAAQCSQATAAGNWAYTYTGTVYAPDPLPAAAVGRFSEDSKGNVTGSQAHTLAGATEVEDISGGLTVNKDCTGSGTINVLLNGQLLRTATLNAAFDSDGNHARLIFTSLTLADGTVLPVVVTVDATRMFPGKN